MIERDFGTPSSVHGVQPIQPLRTRTNARRAFRRKPVQGRRPIAVRLVRYRLDLLTATERCWLEEDLERAAQVQCELLPDQHMRIEGWEISYRYRALGPVGGDYCDIIRRGADERELLVVLGDASGKGVMASLLMARLHALFHSLSLTDLPITELVEGANRILCRHAACYSYATLVCAQATSEGDVEICNAGHCPPLLVGQAGITQIESGGLPLGLFPDAHWTVTRKRVPKGESLFLYTDGLTEARDGSDGEYGVDRLLRTVREGSALPPQSLVETRMQSVAAFQAGTPSSDDVTVAAMRCV
jgi:sigma-B regulation protein RsbU (phosphoserine phosphatase)